MANMNTFHHFQILIFLGYNTHVNLQKLLTRSFTVRPPYSANFLLILNFLFFYFIIFNLQQEV